MSVITFPELTEVEGQLNERRAKLHDIFSEAGPEMDMTKVKSLDGDSAAKVDAIRTLNEEIDDLATKAEGLRTLKRGAENAAERSDAVEDDGPTTKGSFADQVVRSGVLVNKGSVAEIDVDLKALMSTTAGWAPTPIDNGRVIDKATRPVELVDIIPTTQTGQTGSVTYWEETTYTNGAAETSEGASMPEGALALTEQTAAIRKIAVLLPVTDEQLEDEVRVPGYINNRLPFMVRQRLSLQIAVGDGNAPNLKGILNVSGIQTQAKGSDPVPDAVYKAMVKVMTVGQAMPDAYITNPLDWQDVRLLRTSDGIYIWGSPSEAGPARIWGLQAVLAQVMTENTGVVGDFANFSEMAIRKNVEVDVGLINDDFGKGRQTLRAQFRTALIWYRPAAFCEVTGI